MKVLKSLMIASILLASLTACKKEPLLIEGLEGEVITCFKGKHTCLGIGDMPWSHSYITGEFTFAEGTDYQNNWDGPYDQVNKLFGATDCGEYVESRENSAMVGFRHIAGTDLVELLGYAHREDADRNGYNFRHANLLVTPRFQPVSLKISVKNSYYRFSANGTNETLMKRFCSNNTFNGRKIGTWFGGQRTAPVQLQIQHKKNIEVTSSFPKKLNLMDQDDLCSKGLDAISYLKNHESGIYQDYQSECGGNLQVKSLGCDSNIDSNVYSGNSPSSDPGFRYEITCNQS